MKSASDRTTPGLVSQGISLVRGEVQALRAVDLEVPAGSFVAVVGPNGAGKSSLARVLAGLEAPTEGRVLLDGSPLDSIRRRDLARQIAFLAQDPPSDPGFTAAEVALLGRAPHLGALGLDGASDRELAARALARVGASNLADRAMQALSGGERRRIHLARILAQQAPIWILDEPTAHLDLAYQELALRLARDHVDAGGTVVCVLHDLAQAGAVADRVALLHEGRLVAAGAPEQVLTPDRLEPVFGVRFSQGVDPATGASLPLPDLRLRRSVG